MASVRSLSFLFMVLILVPSARAQVTVVTDQSTYVVGDTIRFTIHNAGPSDAYFQVYPGYMIIDPDTGRCVADCYMRFASWWLRAGDSREHSHDTGALPDLPGRYRIVVFAMLVDPGSILTADYELTPVLVGLEETTWGHVKGLYR